MKILEIAAIMNVWLLLPVSKLYNMAHLSLNVFTASKGSNNYILFIKVNGVYIQFALLFTVHTLNKSVKYPCIKFCEMTSDTCETDILIIFLFLFY